MLYHPQPFVRWLKNTINLHTEVVTLWWIGDKLLKHKVSWMGQLYLGVCTSRMLNGLHFMKWFLWGRYE
jgi:hypothetical protein